VILRLPELMAEVTDDDVRTAAASLRPDSRAVVELIPGAGR
jgi:zinc protease